MVYPWSKNCCVRKGVGHFDHKFKGGMGCRPPTTIGVIKIHSLGYHVALFAWS